MPHPVPAAHKSTRRGTYHWNRETKTQGGLLGHDHEAKRRGTWFERICFLCFEASRGNCRGTGDERECVRCGVAYPINGWTQEEVTK